MPMLKITNPNHAKPQYVPKGVRIWSPGTVEEVTLAEMTYDERQALGGSAKIIASMVAQAVTAEGIYGPDWADETKTWAASRPHGPF